jgi:muramoyltetrapeptide carboxypeptidase LdcA involved in peptidoglycan recycling
MAFPQARANSHRELIKPPALRAGDTVAVISLSSGAAHALPARFEQGKRQLAETFGLHVVQTPHASADAGWLREHPEARAADLHWALENPDVHGIVSVIGGEDSIRTVPYLDPDLIAKNPKVFTGYSDTTIQHLVHHLAGVGSFYGMAVLSVAAEAGGIHTYARDSFVRTVMSRQPVGVIEPAAEWTEEMLEWSDEANLDRRRRWVPNYGWIWRGGSSGGSGGGSSGQAVEGPLIGGCMEVLDMARGTDIWPAIEAFEEAVLHLEISEEKPPIDQVRHWLRGYTAMGITERLAALLFSRPENYSLQDTLALYEAIGTELREAGRADLPFVANLDFGHTSPMGLLPLGRTVRVDPEARSIEITEAAVS